MSNNEWKKDNGDGDKLWSSEIFQKGLPQEISQSQWRKEMHCEEAQRKVHKKTLDRNVSEQTRNTIKENILY